MIARGQRKTIRVPSGYNLAHRIKMNKSMAESLARQLLYFAVNSLPTGSDVHYDTFFCPLKQGNYEVVISQIENNEIELRIELDEEAEL